MSAMAKLQSIAAGMGIAFYLCSFVAGAQELTPCRIDSMRGPHATAVVYRYHAFQAGGRRASIYLDDQKICSLYSGKYIVIPIAPGEHQLRGSDPKHGVMKQVFKEGVAYYFRVMVQPTSLFQERIFG
jgi:hypothetical protein